MKLENLDALDCSLYLLLASAEVTDHYLTESEINSILEKAKGLTVQFSLTDLVTHDDTIRQKFNAAFQHYDYIGESAPKGKMNANIKASIFEVAEYMKIQAWFTADFSKTLLNDLVSLAAADGETIKNEQELINRIALVWKLGKPFS